jgi:serine/threonine protein kinase/TPR repeat protein
MNDVGSIYRSTTMVAYDANNSVQKATELAGSIREQWRKGKTPDLAAALADHPELEQYKSIVLQLACDEFRVRRENDQSLSVEEFTRRYPSLRHSLCGLLEFQDLVAEDIDVRLLKSQLRWPEPGSSFLQFELIAELGRGTFGRVFLASEPALGDRLVVVKVAPHGKEEAEILGRLQHANIVPIHSVQDDKRTGLTAFCMPYWGKATLGDVLDRILATPGLPQRADAILNAVQAVNQGMDFLESPAPDRCLRSGSYVDGVIHLGIQLADALWHSHKCGIGHRDLKPSNVLMAPDGRPLLLDFNLSVDARLTVAKIGGTLPYMAPEELAAFVQSDGVGTNKHYDPRSDLFSLGVILYELLTGHLPFGAMPREGGFREVVQSLHKRTISGPEPVRKWNAHVDKRLARLIESCLAANPDDRPETASQLVAALRKQRTPWCRARRWIGYHRRKAALSAIFVACSLLFLTVIAVTRPPYSVREYRTGAAYATRRDYEHAIEHFSEAIRANPAYYDALVGRGRAYQRLAKYQLAFTDYDLASSIMPSIKVDVCIGYCLHRIHQQQVATVLYKKALDAGEVSPAILNNLGFAYFQLAKLDEAEKYIRQAIAMDDGIRAPHYSLVLVLLNKTLLGRPAAPDAFEHVRLAEELGPPSGTLFRDLAEFYATAAQKDPSLVPAAIDHVRKAVQYGADVQALRSNVAFAQLWQSNAFQEALATPQIANPPATPRLIDPLDEEARSIR